MKALRVRRRGAQAFFLVSLSCLASLHVPIGCRWLLSAAPVGCSDRLKACHSPASSVVLPPPGKGICGRVRALIASGKKINAWGGPLVVPFSGGFEERVAKVRRVPRGAAAAHEAHGPALF